jgi:DeoR/GlpR family transcriptional regulator of sugar metabolism
MPESESLLSFERRQRIVAAVNERRSVSVEELAASFMVSPITIRRDLDRLAEEHLIRRVHGGAVALSNIVVSPRASYQATHLSEAQKRIGREAAKRISDGDFLILESGSTCQAVIPHLADRKNLRIVTVSALIVTLLADLAAKHQPGMEIISSGGTLSVFKDFMMGPHARSLFESLRVDLSLHSVTAIDLEAGITADSVNEAEISRTIFERSAKRIIGLVVAEKFETTSFVRVAPVQVFDEIITDSSLDEGILQRYRERGIRLTVV